MNGNPAWDFSGRDGLSLVFRSTDPTTTLNSLIVGFAERGEQIGAGDEPVLMNARFLGISSAAQTRKLLAGDLHLCRSAYGHLQL